MVQIVLIRPGSTDYDEQGRIQGTLDLPLSELGSTEAQRISQELRSLTISAIYSAPCASAWQTATTIGESMGLKPKKLDRMRNLDHGLWQGMLVEDVKRKQPKVYRQWQEQPEIICPPEGEMLSQAQERVQAALTKLLKKHKEGTIALVVPEPLTSLVHSYLAQSQLGDLWKAVGESGSWEVIPVAAQSLEARGVAILEEKTAVTPRAMPNGVS